MESDGEESVRDTVTRLLNEAASNSETRISDLLKVQELVTHRSPDLLREFLSEILFYQQDPSPNVRKVLPAFIERAL